MSHVSRPPLPQPLSVERAFRAVRRSEVAVLVLDAAEGVTTQDFRLAEYIVSFFLRRIFNYKITINSRYIGSLRQPCYHFIIIRVSYISPC